MSSLKLFRGAPATMTDTKLGSFISQLNASAQTAGKRFASQDAVRAGMSLESSTVLPYLADLDTAAQNVERMIRQSRTNLGMPPLTPAENAAAVTAAMLSSSPLDYFKRPNQDLSSLQARATALGNCYLSQTPGSMAVLHERPDNLSLLAYDEAANGNLIAHSIAYNADASTQDQFADAHYPTVVVDQNSLGYTMSIKLHLLQEEVRRSISGDVSDFGRVNLLKAAVEPGLLRNDQTELVPVLRDDGSENDSSRFFAPATDVPVQIRKIDRHDVETNAMRFGVKYDLLAISQTDALLRSGTMDQTDAIDPAIRLTDLYIKLGANGGNNTIRFSTTNLPFAEFNAAPQGNGQVMSLNFKSESLRVRADTKNAAGVAIAELSALNGYVVSLGVSCFGSVIRDRGDTEMTPGAVSVVSVVDAQGTLIPLTSGVGRQIADIFAGAQLAYYKTLQYRTNSNKLSRGQQIDSQIEYQLYAVPTLPPISALRPVGATEADDGERIQALIVCTKLRASNLAMKTHLEYLNTLKEVYSANDSHLHQPATLGVGRHLVNVAYEEYIGDKALDLHAVVNSLETTNHSDNVSAAICSLVRDVAARLYLNSALKVAREMVLGAGCEKPLVLIGTDPYIESYMNIKGDTRYLPDLFAWRIFSSMNRDIRNKITVVFGDSSAMGSGVPCQLHYGNMLWRTEITSMMPITRNGRTSHELTVTPSLRHINHLPIGALIEVKNIDKVMRSSVPVRVNNTPTP